MEIYRIGLNHLKVLNVQIWSESNYCEVHHYIIIILEYKFRSQTKISLINIIGRYNRVVIKFYQILIEMDNL